MHLELGSLADIEPMEQSIHGQLSMYPIETIPY